MNYIFFKSIISDCLARFGFKKARSNFWLRKGKEVTLKIQLQRSAYSALYYIRVYYVINDLPLDYPDWSMTGHTYTGFGLNSQKEQQLAQMCNLENDVPDDVRESILRLLINEAFGNFHYIETERELREMILKRLLPEFKVVLEHLKIDQEQYDQMWQAKRNEIRMQRLAQVFESSPTGEFEICNEEKGFLVTYSPEDQEILVRLNVFVNPYKQNVEEVYQQKLDRLEYFTKIVPFENPMQEVERIEADKPSKLGFMHIELTIPDYVADGEGIEKVKEAIFKMQEEQLSYENFVWFKSKHNGRTCYFEYGHWTFKRAVIMGENGHQCFDFTEETRSHQEMLGDLTNDYDQLEYSDSFALISSEEFQKVWDATTIDHEPEPWD